MIDEFLQKLFDDGKTLKSFHAEYIKEDYEYWFFIRQLSFHWEMTKGLKGIIVGYLNEN